VNTMSPSEHDANVLPEHTLKLCQLRWLDDALLPLNSFEKSCRYAMQKARGLRRRFRVLLCLMRGEEPPSPKVRGRAQAETLQWGDPSSPGSDLALEASTDGDESEAPADAAAPSAVGSTTPGRRRGKLKAGDLVVVLSREEIERTLDEDGKLKGLKFLDPMLEFCGKTFRVFKLVRYILDEHAHQMRKVRNVILLEGVICEGKGIYGRESCDRSCYFFWKDAWVRKIDG